MSDKRFARVSSDPRFKKIARKNRKVKIDSRFQRMFTDKTFTTKYFVDKRGAAIGKTTKEDLHQFYDLSDDEKDDNSIEQQHPLKTIDDKNDHQTRKKKQKTSDLTIKKKKKLSKKGQTPNQEKRQDDIYDLEKDDNTSSDDDDDSDDNDPIIDLARGEGNIDSSSSSDDDDDDSDNQDGEAPSTNLLLKKQHIQNETVGDSDTDESDHSNQEDDIDHQWAELDSNVRKDSNTSRRLAVCNLDWDRITASDLFVLFSSLKTKGIIKSIKIYPSEFGLQRLKNEDCYGPEELLQQNTTKDSNSNVEGEEFSREKLRQYQINRLKYYYAVVDCDSAKTANEIYNEYDGIEFELSGNMLDLRFIPDDMEFDHAPTSVATELPSQSMYTPPEFETTALHQTNVKLTWDETDNDRIKTTMRAFNKDEIDNMDFEAYLASSSDDDDDDNNCDIDDKDDEDESIAKYKSLVQEIDAKEQGDDNDNDMEITWEPGLRESALDLVAKKKAEKEQKNATPWEKYLNKKKEKRKERRKQKKGEDQGSEGEDVDDTPEGVDMSDPFFSQDFGPDFPGKQPKNKKKTAKHTRDKNTEDNKQKDELELLLMDEKDEREHFSLKGIMDNEKKSNKRKKKRKEGQTKEDTFSVNVEDPRFSALFSSHLYAIDPSDPQFKETKAMNAILEERQRRRSNKRDTAITDKKDTTTNITGKKPIKDPSLSFLVNSVKSKTGAFHQRKKKRKHSD